MRLLDVETLELEEFDGPLRHYDVPSGYAILSHVWTDEEVSFREMSGDRSELSDRIGYKKILACCEKAKADGIAYVWIDTCTIDKTSSAELSEAINSMFRWYRDATRCYVYLSDVLFTRKRKRRSKQSETPWISAIRESRWFTRGWTLQELLAPASVEFFAQGGQYLGDKLSLEQEIHQITGIALAALRDNRLSQFSVEERFRWVEKRKTKHEEDLAYCLLGIFGVFMPVNYGEGKDYAVRRLKKEIDEALKHDHGELRCATSVSSSNKGTLPRAQCEHDSCELIGCLLIQHQFSCRIPVIRDLWAAQEFSNN